MPVLGFLKLQKKSPAEYSDRGHFYFVAEGQSYFDEKGHIFPPTGVNLHRLFHEGFMHKTAEEVRQDFDYAIDRGINFIDIYSPNPELRTNIGTALKGLRVNFIKNMFAKCPAGRPGTADEVANVAELLMSSRGAFITGADFLVDGGATASYFYGPLRQK